MINLVEDTFNQDLPILLALLVIPIVEVGIMWWFDQRREKKKKEAE